MGRNILVVEDDRNISDLIHMYLVKEGFDVRIAGDGGRGAFCRAALPYSPFFPPGAGKGRRKGV